MTTAGVSSSVSALFSLGRQAQQVAHQVATATVEEPLEAKSAAPAPFTSAQPATARDPGEALVELKQIAIAYTANLKVITATDQMTATLLDIKV